MSTRHSGGGVEWAVGPSLVLVRQAWLAAKDRCRLQRDHLAWAWVTSPGSEYEEDKRKGLGPAGLVVRELTGDREEHLGR